MNCDPAKLFATRSSLNSLRNWTHGESSDPYAAEAMTHLPGPTTRVVLVVVVVVVEVVEIVVEMDVEVEVVVVVVVVLV